MSQKMWVIVLVVVGVLAAVGIGFAARSQSTTDTQFCDSLGGLEAAVNNLTSLDPTSTTADQFKADVSAVQNAWNGVRSSAQNQHNANTSSLESAWNTFEDAVKSIPSGSSVSAAEQSVKTAAAGLQSAIAADVNSYNCTTTTTTTSST